MDSETGLYYLRARYMDPATATFTSMDSYAGNIYDPASLHRYLYANANPVKYCDPSGHSPLAMLTTSVSCLSMLRVTKIIGAMALFSGLINAGTKALRTIYNNTFYDTEESIDVRNLLEEFINGFTGGGILGTAMIIVGLIAHTTLLKMYIILTGISVVLGVIQTVIAAYKGDEFGVALNVIFTTLSLIAFGNLYAYNKSVSIKSTEGIEQTVKTDASGENLEVKSELTAVEDTPKAGDAGQGGSSTRPTWRQSEIDAKADFPDYNEQISFKDGKEVPYGTKGSVRPDYYKAGSSVDIKNYNVETANGRSNLVNNISKQYYQRSTHLPQGTKQSVMIDVRGQNVSNVELEILYNSIMEKTNNGITVYFKTN
jgi:RHS repeat-associated protein